MNAEQKANLQVVWEQLNGTMHDLNQIKQAAEDTMQTVDDCIARLEQLGIGVEEMPAPADESHPSGVTAEWDGEDWIFRGDLIKKHWNMSNTCFSPSELGYTYNDAARLTPEKAISALLLWLNESLQHQQGGKV